MIVRGIQYLPSLYMTLGFGILFISLSLANRIFGTRWGLNLVFIGLAGGILFCFLLDVSLWTLFFNYYFYFCGEREKSLVLGLEPSCTSSHFIFICISFNLNSAYTSEGFRILSADVSYFYLCVILGPKIDFLFNQLHCEAFGCVCVCVKKINISKETFFFSFPSISSVGLLFV